MSLALPDYSSALAYLYGRVNYERTAFPRESGAVKLERMTHLLARLGSPETRLPAVHIAGTKGKGSTALMVDSILRHAGRSTGLFTSPHLETLEERFVVDGRPVSQADLLRWVRRVADEVEEMDRLPPESGLQGPTFFEITTAVAMLWFEERKVDFAILEVGLGGRLDSTNVCRPRVCAVTSIHYDHMKQLGDTLALIALEKAGVIKPGAPVVSGVIDKEPQAVIRAKAQAVGAPLFELDRDFHVVDAAPGSRGWRFRLRFESSFTGEAPLETDVVELGLPGRHQATNAALAAALALQAGASPSSVVAGLKAATVPARIEVVRRRPTTVLDTAHNAASIAALCRTLREDFPARRRIAVFACSRDKDAPPMLRSLAATFDHVVLTRFLGSARATHPEELWRQIPPADRSGHVAWHMTLDPRRAWEVAHRLATPDDLVCVTGSFFLAGELGPVVSRGGS